ncbi:MAG: four-carbon acid sugar kinase family protein [Negativicutes bacterium]|nr:four-carbon acid sugar kinase family protein [Negativicutes bacterium]
MKACREGDYMGKKIVIIADDLTGANDTGVQLAKQGLSTLVVLEPSQLEALKDTAVIVLDTDSRGLAPAAAYHKAAVAARMVKKYGYDLIYKKVDSTLRGNLGPEIDAIMDECGFGLAVVAPAFPQNGRTTVNAVHLLQGVPLEATEISRDPKCPVKESNIVKLLASQTKRTVGHIGIKVMMTRQKEVIAQAIRQLVDKDVNILVADIWLDEQFAVLAEAVAEAADNVLWVGSAGLAEVLPGLLGMQARRQAMAKPVIVVAGSVSSVTRRQVKLLAMQPNICMLKADPANMLIPAQQDAHIRDCCRKIQDALVQGQDVVLVSGYDDDIVAATNAQGAAMELAAAQVSDLVAAGLGRIISRVMEGKPDISGLALTGGDTAISICHALSAIGLKVVSEVAMGIPLGLIQGGCCHNMPVVTKAGAFGEEDALYRAVLALKAYSGAKAHVLEDDR